VQPTESSRRAHGGDGGQPAVRAVERQQRPEVDVGQPVAVGGDERRVEVLAQPPKPATGLRLEPVSTRCTVQSGGSPAPTSTAPLRRCTVSEQCRMRKSRK
jgi:hypothetical protein